MDIISAVLYDCFPNWIEESCDEAKKTGKKTWMIPWFGNDLSAFAGHTLYACVCPNSGQKWLQKHSLSAAHLIGDLKIVGVHSIGSVKIEQKLDSEIFDASSILNLDGNCTTCKNICKNRKKVEKEKEAKELLG